MTEKDKEENETNDEKHSKEVVNAEISTPFSLLKGWGSTSLCISTCSPQFQSGGG